MDFFTSEFAALSAFVAQNKQWAAPVAFFLAYAESLAMISLLIPAWGAFVALGVFIHNGSVDFIPVWIAGSLGAALGDWMSYWLGFKFKYKVGTIWPLSKHPTLLPKGEVFFNKWGWLAIVAGRFTGPLRASVPLVAGILAMPRLKFQLANFGSAFLWAGILLQLVPLGAWFSTHFGRWF
jgi:membrane protein DedA with SNARE-associated domain